MSLITLNFPLVDFVTITSFADSFCETMTRELIGNSSGECYQSIQRGYIGKIWVFVQGTVFIGKGTQKGVAHGVMKVSGYLAHAIMERLLMVVNSRPEFHVKCSRLDYQITVNQPRSWSQINYRNRMEKAGFVVGYPTPSKEDGVTLETVYVGVRAKVDRFYRVYVKLQDDLSKLLRVEVELKKRRSRKLFNEILSGGVDSIRRVLDYEIELIIRDDKKLYKIVHPHLADSLAVRVQSNESNIAGWLVKTVFPAMDRFLASDSADKTKVISALYDILENRGL